MAGYVKVWTSLRSNNGYLSLSGLCRGAYLQLLLWCKSQRDDGTITASGWTQVGVELGVDRRTARHVCDKIAAVLLLTHGKNAQGVITIEIHNYKHWQEIKVKEVVKRTRSSVQKCTPLRPDQTRPDQTIPKDKPSAPITPKEKKGKRDTDPRMTLFKDYWMEDYGKVFPGEKYVMQGGKDAAAIKRLLGSASLEEARAAASWFLRLEPDNDRDFLGNLGKEISLFVMKYNAIRQRMRLPKVLEPGDPGYVP